MKHHELISQGLDAYKKKIVKKKKKRRTNIILFSIPYSYAPSIQAKPSQAQKSMQSMLKFHE